MIEHGIEVRASRPEDDRERDRFVDQHPEGTFFHLAPWNQVVEAVFGHPQQDLLAVRADQVVGVLPLSKCRSLLGSGHLISVPYAVYGGPLGSDAAVERRLVEAGVELAARQGVGRLELRCLDDHDLGLVESDLYATFVQQLPDDPAGVMRAMPKRARAEVRKARERFGLELSEGAWYIEDLVRLFHRSKRNLGSPGLPGEWFHGLQKAFGERVAIHLARRGSEPLAAMMSFLWRDTVLIYYIGTADGANSEYKATNFLCTAVQEWAVQRGFRKFDWSRSRKDSGAFRFKVHQGGEPQDLHYVYHLERSKSLPSFNPSNPRTRILRDTWSRMPMWLAVRLSKRLARYLP